MTKRHWMIRGVLGTLNLVLASSVAAQSPDDPGASPLPPQQQVAEPSGAGASEDTAGVPAVRQAPAQPLPGTPEFPRRTPPTSQAVATIVVDSDFARPSRRRLQEPRPRPDRGDREDVEEEPSTTFHGLRLGYMATLNYDEPTDPNDIDSSPKRQLDLSSPHNFVLGYEIAERIIGGGWLDILLIANGTIVGLEQSKFMPNGNLLVGFEFRKSFQAGVGINLAPVKDKPAHMILAAGWTPSTGELLLPVHVFVIPDVDGNHRLGATVGVNWEI